MKITTKKVIEAKASPKAKTSPKAEVAIDGSFHTRKSISSAIGKNKIDGATSWLGDHIDGTIVTALVTKTKELTGARLAKGAGKFLTVSARTLFVWPLTGIAGDIYERAHSPSVNVRGSIKLLRKSYGEAKVKIVSLSEAVTMVQKLKTDPGCKKGVMKLAPTA